MSHRAGWRSVRRNPAGPAFHSWPRFGQQAAKRGRVGALDLEDLGAARGACDQRDGAATEAETEGVTEVDVIPPEDVPAHAATAGRANAAIAATGTRARIR